MRLTFKIFIVISSILFLSFPSQADDVSQADLDALLQEINRLDASVQNQLKALEQRIDSLNELQKTLSRSTDHISERAKEFQKKYEKIIEAHEEVNKLSESNTEIIKKLAENNVELNNLKSNLQEVNSRAENSKTIVTWVTLIVTVVVILIGLFFSKLFLDLYSNYKVLEDRQKSQNKE